jgi:hypothetical protein
MSGNDPDTESSPRAQGLESQVEGRPKLDAAAQERLGSMLARHAGGLLCEPVPDVFLALLAKLEAKEPEE